RPRRARNSVAPAARRSDLESVQRDESFLRFGVDVREHLDVRLEPGAAELCLEQTVDLVDAGGVVHRDLDPDRLVLAVADRDVFDRRRREGVDADVAALERYARTALLHVERVGDAEDAGLERERLA